jgi:hypothetical protein
MRMTRALSVREAVEWCGVTVREVTRLRRPVNQQSGGGPRRTRGASGQRLWPPYRELICWRQQLAARLARGGLESESTNVDIWQSRLPALRTKMLAARPNPSRSFVELLARHFALVLRFGPR